MNRGNPRNVHGSREKINSTFMLAWKMPAGTPTKSRHALQILRILAFTIAAAGCSKKQPADTGVHVSGEAEAFPIRVQLDWVAEPEHGGFYQAQARGYFREAGLDVKLVQGGPNAFGMQKLATGQADIGQSDSTNVLLAIARGLPLIHIGAVFQNDPSVLMMHAENPVARFEDLDGRTIMARPEWAFLPYLKRKYGILPSGALSAGKVMTTDYLPPQP